MWQSIVKRIFSPIHGCEVENTTWSSTTMYLHGIPYVVISVFVDEEKEAVIDEDVLELKKKIARTRWTRFWSYWELAKLFREMRKERRRDPLEVELFAYLQLPSTYNWRNPTEDERYRMLRWAQGLDDPRPRKSLFARSKWLADQVQGE